MAESPDCAGKFATSSSLWRASLGDWDLRSGGLQPCKPQKVGLNREPLRPLITSVHRRSTSATLNFTDTFSLKSAPWTVL